MGARSDSGEELAKLISMALDNSSMREFVKNNVQHYRAYYSWDRVARDMIGIISRDLCKD